MVLGRRLGSSSIERLRMIRLGRFVLKSKVGSWEYIIVVVKFDNTHIPCKKLEENVDRGKNNIVL